MDKPKAEKPGADGNRLRTYIALALVGVAAILLVVWLTSGDDGSPESNSGQAEIVGADDLRDAAEDRDLPIYWAGERQGTELELSEPDENRTYVRYLTDGAEAGDAKPDYLTVGTYAAEDPVADLRRQGKEPEGVLGTAPGGATVYFNRAQPLSIYVAFPEVDAQVEVYDPRFRQALQLVNSGQIVPVD